MCGIIAVLNNPSASNLVKFGLHCLQHRGEEAVGISSSDSKNIYIVKKRGLVGDVITDEDCNKLPGSMAIGHVRYSTEGGPSGTNTQPLFAKLSLGPVAIAHNGHMAKCLDVRNKLEEEGSIFQTSSDTELVLHLMAKSKHIDFFNKLKEALQISSGAYSIVLLTNEGIILSRDKYGIRPLIIGKIGETIIAASESCVMDFFGAEIIRNVNPGEQIWLNDFDVNIKETESSICVFEHIYFARPDSILDGKSVYNSRIELGKMLAIENPVEADICVPVPDSGIEAAVGYSYQSGIPFSRGIIRMHYAGRTFIQPTQEIRNNKIKMKLSCVRSVINGKRVVVIDDSIVRGNTSKRIVSILKEAGAREVHFRISSPPIKFPCYYGINTPSMEELIASFSSIDEIKKVIGCNSLSYLSESGMKKALGISSYCDACFTGKYFI